MKAIPTQYKGVTFRSRLEADWALHFDDLGYDWQYEPEGYQLSDGTWYSPDFWLPGPKVWVEVKGDHDQRITKLEQFAADLWAEAPSQEIDHPAAPMVILLRSPAHYDEEWTYVDRVINAPKPLGVRGLKKRYSVAFATCPECNQATIIALWQPNCRNCGFVHLHAIDTWMPSMYAALPFRRLPRPPGRGR